MGGYDKTADICFEDIIEYCQGNKESFEGLCRNFDAVVPFVGAGLSAFAYPCWRDFLQDASRRLDMGEKAEFSRLIKMRDYEKAASIIEKTFGAEQFRNEIKAAFGAEKLYAPGFEPIIRRQAVFMLPELFKNLVLTTNFDAAIERAYELHDVKFENVGHPGNLRLLQNALLRGGGKTLYKFHGDISQPEGLVLTKERYDSCYRRDGALVRGLRACFRRRSMLFLGCSLSKDRTMDVLQDVLQDSGHYAILGCEKDKLEEKMRQMRNYNICAVFFPAKEYGSVCAVLEKLKEILTL